MGPGPIIPALPPPPLPLAAPQVSIQEKEKEVDTVAPYSRSFNRTAIATVLLSADGGLCMVRALQTPTPPCGRPPPWHATGAW